MCVYHYHFFGEIARSEIQNTIFASRQPEMQNIYFKTHQNKN